MTEHEIARIAFERAWRVYQLLNRDENGQTKRRLQLKQFILRCCEHGATDAEAIVVMALIHLKQLDEDAGRVDGYGSGKNGTNGPVSD